MINCVDFDGKINIIY